MVHQLLLPHNELDKNVKILDQLMSVRISSFTVVSTLLYIQPLQKDSQYKPEQGFPTEVDAQLSVCPQVRHCSPQGI